MEDPHSDNCCVQAELRELFLNMPDDEVFLRISELFKAMGDTGRLKVIEALSSAEFCVQHLAEFLKISPSALSHQLRVLRAARIVKFRKEGKMVIYSLDDEHILSLLKVAKTHVMEQL